MRFLKLDEEEAREDTLRTAVSTRLFGNSYVVKNPKKRYFGRIK